MRQGWWRENRWWLAALPFAVALLGGASSYHLHDYWYVPGLHHQEASASQGELLRVTDDYADDAGHTSRSFRVRLSGINRTSTYPYDMFEELPRIPPPGQQALVVHLDWEADPDQAMKYCQIALVDDRGRRYEIAGQAQADPCTPDGHGGPDPGTGLTPPGEGRPRTWSTAPVFLVPEGVRITQVRLWWELPDYVSLNVS